MKLIELFSILKLNIKTVDKSKKLLTMEEN